MENNKYVFVKDFDTALVQLREILDNFNDNRIFEVNDDDIRALEIVIKTLDRNTDKFEFKKLILATGEEYENGTIESYRNEMECLPSNIALIRLGKQKVLINTDFILSVETKSIIF
ncbi:hypothetical protein [Clostridium perfringens]|uniref:hypothetical protein n=1 Tax=Clostridium perfringens TaxID=1502 RepID=UPI00070667FC|nr:hypothetical protein [Clostridium perfringens]ALG49402.1 hypothetical protein FORC3_2025 [Clostridium perfringens]ELC8461412.1 hypothetical protein [Clostridium perfringens]MDK0802885.1 hypothetical protein [Clostridium perfringens]